jgi:hypothetical protein
VAFSAGGVGGRKSPEHPAQFATNLFAAACQLPEAIAIL